MKQREKFTTDFLEKSNDELKVVSIFFYYIFLIYHNVKKFIDGLTVNDVVRCDE